MKIVIDIPDALYNRIRSVKSVPDLTGTDIVNAILCIDRGLELTGRLIDADTFIGADTEKDLDNLDLMLEDLWNARIRNDKRRNDRFFRES